MALCRIPFLVSVGFYSVVCFSSCCLRQIQKTFLALQNLSFYNAQYRVGGGSLRSCHHRSHRFI